MIRSLLTALFLLGLTLTTQAQEGPSTELGKRLFESPDLGSNGRSCSTCHPQAKGLEKIGRATDEELRDTVNQCIQKTLDGPPLSPGTQELESIILYLRTLAGEKS